MLHLIITLLHYDHYGARIRLEFNRSCLKQSNNLTYDKGHKVNVYIVYELGAFSSNDNDPELRNCLFGAVTLTKMLILISMGILVMVI